MDKEELGCRVGYILLAIVFISALLNKETWSGGPEPAILAIIVVFGLTIVGMLIMWLYLSLKDKK